MICRFANLTKKLLYNSLLRVFPVFCEAFQHTVMSVHRSKNRGNVCNANKVGDAPEKFFEFSYEIIFRYSNISSFVELFHDGGRYHIEISLLTCSANQWTGFYMITASIIEELSVRRQKHARMRGIWNSRVRKPSYGLWRHKTVLS